MFRYFLGDNENAIKIKIWCSLIANLLMEVKFRKVKQKEKRKAFSPLINFVRLHIDLKNYWRCGIEKLIKDDKIIMGKIPNKRCAIIAII
jgi:hypothetical protein